MDHEASLFEIGNRHGTDKMSPLGYHVPYGRLLGPRRNSPTTLLEIGIHTGASLRTWLEWFGEGLDLWAIDIHSACMQSCHHERLRCRTVDAGDPEQMAKLAAEIGSLDVVVDDGSHINRDQIVAFEALWPIVRPGGLYIIEDLCTSYWDNYLVPDRPATPEYLRPRIDQLFAGSTDSDCMSIQLYRMFCVLEKKPLATGG